VGIARIDGISSAALVNQRETLGLLVALDLFSDQGGTNDGGMNPKGRAFRNSGGSMNGDTVSPFDTGRGEKL
jgi:hypothetical protein